MKRKLEIVLGIVYLAVACFLGFATVEFYQNSREVLNVNELDEIACLIQENGESLGNIAKEYDVVARELVPSYQKNCNGLKDMIGSSRNIVGRLLKITNNGIPDWMNPFETLKLPVKAVDANLDNIEKSLQSTSDALASYETIHGNVMTILNNSAKLLSQCADQVKHIEENRRNAQVLLLWANGLVALCFALSGIVKLISPSVH